MALLEHVNSTLGDDLAANQESIEGLAGMLSDATSNFETLEESVRRINASMNDVNAALSSRMDTLHAQVVANDTDLLTSIDTAHNSVQAVQLAVDDERH